MQPKQFLLRFLKHGFQWDISLLLFVHCIVVVEEETVYFCHCDSVIIRLNVPYPVAIACLGFSKSRL